MVAAEALLAAARRHGLVPAASTVGRNGSEGDVASLTRRLCLEGRIPPEALYRALAADLALPYADLGRFQPAPELAARLPAALVRRARLLPLAGPDGELLIATPEPSERQAFEAARRVLGGRGRLAVLEPEAHGRLLAQALAEGPSAAEVVDATALLDRLLLEAYLRRSSDIHLEPTDAGLRVRLRTDGILRVVLEGLGRAERMALVTRVKVLAGLDISEQRLPQDGAFRHPAGFLEGEVLEIRVASLPTDQGERLTLRLLGLEEAALELEALGLGAEGVGAVRAAMRQTRGLVLIAGPTGSGKTTTLYSALAEIDRERRNVLTVEDPVERRLAGISQVGVGGERFTFARALRSFLRHDPDVILVGEIRDGETADAAFKAAMTGHLVLSTVHTATAVGAVERLVDLSVEPYRIASALSLVVAQRLVRRVCQHCRRERPAEAAEVEFLEEAGPVAEPVGCPRCIGTGFRGRIGLFEWLGIDRALARAIGRGLMGDELEQAAQERLWPLARDAREKVARGLVTPAEALEVALDRA